MSLLRELLLSPPDGNRRHARAGLTRLRFFLDDRVALCWFLALLCAAIRPAHCLLTACRSPVIGGKSDIINSSEKFVEQNSGLVIEQIRFSELAAKKVVICIVAAAFVIREGNPHSPLLARYDLGELLRVRARIRRDRLHEVLGDAHALLGDLEVLGVPLATSVLLVELCLVGRCRWRSSNHRRARFCRRTGTPPPCTQESRPLSRRAACQLNRSPVRSGVPETSWPYRGGVPLGRRGRSRRRAKSDQGLQGPYSYSQFGLCAANALADDSELDFGDLREYGSKFDVDDFKKRKAPPKKREPERGVVSAKKEKKKVSLRKGPRSSRASPEEDI